MFKNNLILFLPWLIFNKHLLQFWSRFIKVYVHSFFPHFQAYLWGCYGRQHQKLHWSQDRQHSTAFFSLTQLWHHRRLPDWWVWFPLDEFMLTIPDKFHFFQLLGGDIENKLLHHFPRDAVEADCPAVALLLLLAFSEDWSDISFPPVPTHISQSSWTFKSWQRGAW